MNYKLNKYLYIKEKSDIVVVMNLLNQSIFALPKYKADMLKLNDFESIEKSEPTFFSAMSKLGVIISADEEEIDQIKMKNRNVIYDNRTYRLTLNPTLECNFKCWYCYENHPEGKMTESTMQAVINHVKRQIEIEKIEHLVIDWFGGEPLLYFDEIMYPLLKAIIKLTKDNNILYSSSITSNGYLINSERIKKFEEVGLNNFQITLDGNKALHDKIRFTGDRKGSFNQIIENVNLLAQMDKVNISLRINYTEKTLLDITDIIPEIEKIEKSKLLIIFQQVWQDSLKKYVSSNICVDSFRNNGFRVDQYHVNSNGYVCYADRKGQAVINFDGKVFKCTARDFSNYPEDGILQDSGEIEWNVPLLSKRLGNATFENKHCLKCNLLPACFGPCSQKMVEYKKTDDFMAICLRGGVVQLIEQEIEKFYNNIKF